MPPLADVANVALPLQIGTVHVTPDGLLGIHESPRPSNQRFQLDDLLYHVTLSPETTDEGSFTRFRIWAELGYVPYTAQAPEQRRGVLSVLRAARGLERACFVVDPSQKILVIGETISAEPMTVDSMVYEVLLFVQEARPYVRILADYL
ncbi:hypothetical protein [Arenibaculum pallidiluteum]|uniref:hypothetical protein n=1 Tax=Arenibaculum pallidiluteum TaxID=2812559 RepID=UPI001A976BA2|nr:hypothetical protein [Arenibaculum pallidiluteum]